MSLSLSQRPSAALVKQLVFNALNVDNAKSALFYYVLGRQLLKAYRHLRARGLLRTAYEGYVWLSKTVMLLALRIPPLSKKVEAEIGKAKKDLIASIVPSGPSVTRHLSLPASGQTTEWILNEMKKMDGELSTAADWKAGKLSGAVYHGGDDMAGLICTAFERYVVSNPLHPDVFPAVRKMDAEIVAMCLRMYNAPSGAGTTTSGGTESILMSVKAHRDWARAVKGITEPEIIIPASAHAAFDKAGDYFRVKVHHIPVDPITRKVNLKHVARAINANTIMLVGSAINFPDGNMDDIPALGHLAYRNRIGLHVDCCLGSFIVPFVEAAGYHINRFDFRVEGVTAISCDTHKYGFAPKGSSVIMYHSPDLRKYQYYVNAEWSGGVYASPSMAGSRPGSLIAGTWAAMHYMGQEGYLKSAQMIVGAAKRIEAAIRDEIPELYVLGEPPASVIAFGHVEGCGVNVHEVGDAMSKRGWHLNALSGPPAVHIACTRLTVPVVEQFITELKECVAEAKSNPSGKGNMVAVYGLGTSSAVGPAIVGRLAGEFLNALYLA